MPTDCLFVTDDDKRELFFSIKTSSPVNRDGKTGQSQHEPAIPNAGFTPFKKKNHVQERLRGRKIQLNAKAHTLKPEVSLQKYCFPRSCDAHGHKSCTLSMVGADKTDLRLF